MSTQGMRMRVRALRALACAGIGVSLLSASAHASAQPPEPRLTGLRAAAVTLALPGLAGRTAAGAAGCGRAPHLVCSVVDVPLDRTGAVPGTIHLHVETLPATGTPRGTIFLVAGGPGQGSAQTFGLGSSETATYFRALFPGYTLVAYDDRGTGDSGVLDCPSLQAADAFADVGQIVADCATSLGARRDFYSTADHAEDLEAVRQSLGVDRVAIWGVSYGTKLALAYALAHPAHVERLLLDSVVVPDTTDPFRSDALRALPPTLESYCAGGSCRGATSDFAADVVTLANRLAAAPLRGSVRETSGRSTPVVLGAVDFLGLVTDADLSPGLAAVLPAVVHAAVAGRPLPLLHLVQLANRASGASDSDLSFALYLATECGDGPFPWSPETPVAARDEAVQAALAALPVGTFGPFGPWAEGFGDTDLCVGWPSPAGRGGALGAGPLPDVPVLALSGGLDLRTPTSGAAAVVARFPQGRLLVVPGVGHSVLTTDPTGCSQRAVRQWMLGLAPATACARAKPYLAPLAAYPVPSSKKLDARQTLGVVTRTVREAEATWLLTDTGAARQAPVSGLYGGKLVSSGRVIELDKYSIAPGVNVTGALMLGKAGPPLVFKGALFVRGSTAAQGVLQLSGGALHGTLGRRKVGG